MTERELLLHFTGYSAFGSGHEYVFGVRSGVTQCRGRRVRNRVIERKKRKKSRDDRQREREEQKCGEPKRKAITRVHPAVGKPGLIWWDTVLSATRSYQLDGAFAVTTLHLQPPPTHTHTHTHTPQSHPRVWSGLGGHLCHLQLAPLKAEPHC